MCKVNLKYIKLRRIQLGLTQAKMAKLVGMKSAANYNRYENGTYKLNADDIPKIANALQTNVEILFSQKN